MLQYSNIYLTLNVATCRVSWELHKIILLKLCEFRIYYISIWFDICFRNVPISHISGSWILFFECTNILPRCGQNLDVIWKISSIMKVSMEKILIDIFWEEKTLSYGKFTMLIRKKKCCWLYLCGKNFHLFCLDVPAMLYYSWWAQGCTNYTTDYH